MEKESSGYILLVTFCLCNGVVIVWNVSSLSQYASFITRVSLLAGVGLLFPNIRAILDEKYHSCNFLMCLTILSVLISAFVNRANYTGAKGAAINFALRLLFLVWYCEYLDLYGITDFGLKCLFAIIAVYCVLSDVLAVVAPSRVYVSADEYYDNFLVGNKFSLCYLHLVCLALFCTVIKGDYASYRLPFLLLLALSYFASLYSECTTMVVGITVFVLLIIFAKKVKDLLYNRAFFLAYFIACNTILLVAESVLQIPVVRYLIEQVLHESADLTSRTTIYSRIEPLFNLSPLFGVGLDNNYTVSYMYTKAADVQNGIIDVFVSYGWVGVAIMIMLLIYVVYRSRVGGHVALLSALYIYVALSSVEITLRCEVYVMMMLIILTSWNKAEEESDLAENALQARKKRGDALEAAPAEATELPRLAAREQEGE